MHSPLEQFNIIKILPINLFGLDFSLTNSGLMMALVLIVLLLLWLLLRREIGSSSMNHNKLEQSNKNGTFELDLAAPPAISNEIENSNQYLPDYKIGRLQAAAEILYEAVEEMVGGTVGESGRRFIPFIFTLFIFILLCNLLGMIPGSFTATSHIAVTFAMAATIFVVITMIGIYKHGMHFMSLFMPSGTPPFLMPLIFIVELFAYLARPISLSLRLAANMTAGHIVLKVIASFVIMCGALLGFMPFGLLIVLTAFEFFIAILQAYIFTILTCVYLNDALNLH